MGAFRIVEEPNGSHTTPFIRWFGVPMGILTFLLGLSPVQVPLVLIKLALSLFAVWTWLAIVTHPRFKSGLHGWLKPAFSILSLFAMAALWWYVTGFMNPSPAQKIPTSAEIAEEVVKTMKASQRPAPTFKDVPTTHPAWRFISAFVRSEVSAGCGDKLFCPDSLVTRTEQAVFLLRGKEGPDFTPPPCTAPIFSDVPCSSPFAPWINELARRGIATDCGGGRYCPSATVSRMQMAISALRTEEGADFTPPECSTPTFQDIPCSHPSSLWIEELVRRGLPAKYGGGSFQPDKKATRADTAVFLVTAFHLPLP